MKKREDAEKGGNKGNKVPKNRHSKSINDSRQMKDFKERGHRRHNKDIAKKNKPDFVDKRKKLAHKGR